jgi:hypothetical protein
MKKLILLIAIIFAASLSYIGCTEGPTELAFRNSTDSDGPINDIVWVKDNIEWSRTDGYDINDVTHSQEVDKLTSSVVCTVDAGLGWVDATVIFPATGTGSLSLDEGTSYTFTLEATPVK